MKKRRLVSGPGKKKNKQASEAGTEQATHDLAVTGDQIQRAQRAKDDEIQGRRPIFLASGWRCMRVQGLAMGAADAPEWTNFPASGRWN